MSSESEGPPSMADETPRVRPGRVGPKMIPLDDLLAHPLNSNVMPPDLQAKLRVHIKRTGRYPFLVVRPHPGGGGKYQVLDGHHRVAILRDLGHSELRGGFVHPAGEFALVKLRESRMGYRATDRFRLISLRRSGTGRPR